MKSDKVTKQQSDKVKIRTDRHRMAIKYQSFDGPYSHGWSNLESGFKTVAGMDQRFNELLEEDKYVEG